MIPVVSRHTTLESLLPLILEHLPVALAAPGSHAPLRACAGVLPSRLRGGLECRLDGTSAQVDFHQSLQREDIAAARTHIDPRIDPLFDHPVWRRTAAFLAAWDGTWREQIRELYFEFDGVAARRNDALPSLFVCFDTLPAAETRTAALAALDILSASSFSPSPAFNRCFDLQASESVPHIGVMLSRPDAPLRLNIRVQGWDTLAPTLRRIGWDGDFECVSRLAEWLREFKQVTVTAALDIDTVVHPHIGLELYFPASESWTEQTLAFLAVLAERNLCTPEKRAGLIQVLDKLISPENTTAAWPDELILQALHDPDHRLSALSLSLTHFKLTAYPDGRISSKSYLMFEHHWIDTEFGPTTRSPNAGADQMAPVIGGMPE